MLMSLWRGFESRGDGCGCGRWIVDCGLCIVGGLRGEGCVWETLILHDTRFD